MLSKYAISHLSFLQNHYQQQHIKKAIEHLLKASEIKGPIPKVELSNIVDYLQKTIVVKFRK